MKNRKEQLFQLIETFIENYILGTETGILLTLNLSIFLIYWITRKITLKLYKKLKEKNIK
jgi:hypothetical protein